MSESFTQGEMTKSLFDIGVTSKDTDKIDCDIKTDCLDDKVKLDVANSPQVEIVQAQSQLEENCLKTESKEEVINNNIWDEELDLPQLENNKPLVNYLKPEENSCVQTKELNSSTEKHRKVENDKENFTLGAEDNELSIFSSSFTTNSILSADFENNVEEKKDLRDTNSKRKDLNLTVEKQESLEDYVFVDSMTPTLEHFSEIV